MMEDIGSLQTKLDNELRGYHNTQAGFVILPHAWQKQKVGIWNLFFKMNIFLKHNWLWVVAH